MDDGLRPSSIRGMKIRDVMTEDVVTVSPETPLKEVARLLAEWKISGAPVVGSDGNVLGVISESDILWKEEVGRRRKLDFLHSLDDRGRQKCAAVNAGEAMTRPAVMIDENAFVSDAARLMLERRVKRLPVVANGRLAGIVTRADLIRAFARGDDEIEREIREDVLTHAHWIPRGSVRVTVDKGRVRLQGEVETPDLAESVRFFVERVPGVVSVDSRLRSPSPVTY
jgi:CBS domain-containing protein